MVVALAGYLVIRYSQAGVRTFSRMSDSGLTNRSGTFRASFRLPLMKATAVDPVYTTVGTLRENVLGMDHTDLATSYNNLAIVEHELNNCKKSNYRI